MKILFTKNSTVEAQGQIVQTFKAGEVYELSASSARRWIRRNAATEVQGSVKPAPTKSEPVAEQEPAKVSRPQRKYVRKPPITSTEAAS